MHREKCSQQDLDVMKKDQLGGSNIQAGFWDDLLLQQQQQGKPAFPKIHTTRFGNDCLNI
jgi:hypothetical protein